MKLSGMLWIGVLLLTFGMTPLSAKSSRTYGVSGVDLSAIDDSVRPQDDFYQFTNGNWLAKTTIPPSYTSYSIYTQVYEDTEQAIRSLVQKAADNPESEEKEQQLIGRFYLAWMQQDKIEQAGIDAINPELERISAITNIKDLVDVMLWLDIHGVSVPFTLYVQPDLKDASKHMLYMHQSGLTLPDREYYLNETQPQFARFREALGMYTRQMLGYLPRSDWQALSSEVVQLEKQLAALHWPEVENRDVDRTYNPYKVTELGKLSPLFPWQSLNSVLQLTDVISIDQPEFIQGLAHMIEHTELDVWKAYLAYRLLDSRASHLPENIDNTGFLMHGTILAGQQKQKPRWRRGVGLISKHLADAAGKLYVEQYFPPEAKKRMRIMVDNVLEQFAQRLPKLAWLTEETRQAALQKLSQFNAKIGYPDKWRDYADLSLSADDHMANIRLVYASNSWHSLLKLGQPIDPDEWFMSPQTVNAYYDPTMNEIVFPAARLQPPFFQLQADDAINYGAIGAVIGHEISHGFDDQGSKFDGTGSLKNWWTDKDRASFNERAEVLTAQFNQYEALPDMFVNGELTLAENIGDLSGVTLAYYAYLDSLAGQPSDVLDGFTGEQRFFLGYAMSRRGKMTTSAQMARLINDPHAPLEFRVNGVVRNMPEFYQAFGVKEGDAHWLPESERISFW